jgi:hypothetical protein
MTKKIRKRKHSIDSMRLLAINRGGKCNSLEYCGYSNNLEWECSLKHIWKATPNNILKGKWCPKCSCSLSERICRSYFEAIFGKPFTKERPVWCVGDKGFLLELDGYNEELKIAFEHQGKQHYIKNSLMSKSDKDLEIIQKRDSKKRLLCKENGIILIEIPALGFYTKMEDLEDFIFEELSKNNIYPQIKRPVLIDPKNYYISEDVSAMNRLREKSISKGGRLLSTTYTGMKSFYDFICANGHTFSSVGGRVLHEDKWCKQCSMEILWDKIKKPIVCTTNGKEYPSTTAAAKELGVCRTSITHVLVGKQFKIRGLSFKYVTKKR